MKTHFVNCKNEFNEGSLNELVAILEAKEGVGIYIDCIGHTRSERETARYVEALEKRYGDRLVEDNGITWYPIYYLKA